MSNWNKAKKLMKKLFDSGWLKVAYGQIESCGKEVSYPLSYEDTEFLVNFFKNNNKKENTKKYVNSTDREERHELRIKAYRCVNLTYQLKMNKDIIIDIVVDMFGGKRVELEKLSLAKIFMRYYEEGLDEDLLRESMTE